MTMRLRRTMAGLVVLVMGSWLTAQAGPYKPIESRIFEAVKYEGATRVLTVVFHTGAAYAFYEVPRQVYDDFLRIVNRGEYFNRNIRKVYRSERLDRYPGQWCTRD